MENNLEALGIFDLYKKVEKLLDAIDMEKIKKIINAVEFDENGKLVIEINAKIKI